MEGSDEARRFNSIAKYSANIFETPSIVSSFYGHAELGNFDKSFSGDTWREYRFMKYFTSDGF